MALTAGAAVADDVAVPPAASADPADSVNAGAAILLPDDSATEAGIAVEPSDSATGEAETLTGTSADDDLNTEGDMSSKSGGHCPHSRRALAPTS